MISKRDFLSRILMAEKLFFHHENLSDGIDNVSLRECFINLKSDNVINDLKIRTILLLRVYSIIDNYKSQSSETLKDHLFSILEDDFRLYRIKGVFLDIISSIKNDDFFPFFYIDRMDNTLDIAFDILLLAKEFQFNNTYNDNEFGFVKTIIQFKNPNDVPALIVYPMFYNESFSKIEINLNSLSLSEKDISFYQIINQKESKVFFDSKLDLFKKNAKPILVDIMFQMEFNRDFWGLKKLFIYRAFLELFVRFLKME